MITYNKQRRNKSILSSPRTEITGFVFVRWTTNATSHSIHVLITFRAVLSKVNASTEHASDVSVTLIETLLHDCVYEWAAMEQHALTGLI